MIIVYQPIVIILHYHYQSTKTKTYYYFKGKSVSVEIGKGREAPGGSVPHVVSLAAFIFNNFGLVCFDVVVLLDLQYSF